MKKMKRVLSLVLAAGLLVGTLASCGSNGGTMVDEIQQMDYEEQSSTLYQSELEEFYDVYQEAKKETTNVSLRFAKMAIAEAKLMESGVMLPTKTTGGRYQITRVAPYSVTPVLWGHDQNRYHQAIVTTDLIAKEDIEALRKLYAEKVGTGTYEQAAKDYLTQKGYTLKDDYSYPYTSDPKTWDILSTSRAVDSEAVVNTYDGLFEYDLDGKLQPALAESYEVSEDGLTYTFKIKKGIVWTDAQGRKVADVKADDFVAGLQHLLDAQGGTEYLIQDVIVGVDDYLTGKTTDFTTVGIKAPDDTTLVYTLTEPCPHFMTMLSYSVFAPMSRQFYKSKGGKFGEDYNVEATSYTYGKTPENIAYCGPYLVTGATAENSIVFKANPKYWNADNINVKTITWLFNDGSDATKAYKDTISGTLDNIVLNAAALELAKSDGVFDKNVVTSRTTADAFMFFLNINRAAYANVADETAAVSAMEEDEKVRTNYAMRNVHFRRAICFALDRGAYNAQGVGEELKNTSLTNSYTPGNYVSLEEDVTVDINGESKTFPAGTFYGEIMQAQIDADGFPVKVWDSTADSGMGSSVGFDGWYNADKAVEELETAIKELKKEGVKINKKNPIHVDLPYPSNNETFTNMANSTKQSIEASLGGKVVVDLVECTTLEDWYYAGYYTDSGKEANYNIYDCSGWIPDYGDPSTYLDTFLPEYAGYMAKCIGIY